MNKNTFLTEVPFILFIFIILFSSVTVLSNNQDKDVFRVESKVTTAHKLQYENTETSTDIQLVQKEKKKSSNVKVLAYHDARKQGDIQKIKEFEASFKHQFSNVGESKNEVITLNIGTVSYLGMPDLPDRTGGSSHLLPLEWDTDILVNILNNDHREFNPAMATGSDGTIYMACENYGLSGYNNYIQTFYSTDGGNSWIASGYMSSTLADLHEPSIAVGEGTQDLILISYIVDPLDGSLPYPEVATLPIPITSVSWTIIAVPIYNSYEGYAKPHIFTDSWDFTGWYAYLTCEWIVGSASNNYNVVFWRSTDQGSTWTDPPLVPLGDADGDGWRDPDGTYGTIDNNVYVACYNATDSTLYTIVSENFGFSFTDTIAIRTLTYVPSHFVDPDIEAGTANSNIMLAFTTGSLSSGDVTGYTYSQDAGYTWSSTFYLPGYTSNNEWAVELNANEGGGSWHLTYTSNFHVFYSVRPQDLSSLWQTVPDTVDDAGWASGSYPKKAITSDWSTDEPGIAWSDYRSPTSGDYDIYFDRFEDLPVLVPENVLAIYGYDHAIPLYWDAPVGFAPLKTSSASAFGGLVDDQNIQSNNLNTESVLLSYNVYRGTTSGGPYTLLDNVDRQYYRDMTTSNGVTYYYVVQAVYDDAISGYSNEGSAAAVTNGYVINSGWTSSTPVLNGTISAGEWVAASTKDIKGSGVSLPVTLYTMNDGNYLYFAVDDPNNTVGGTYDELGIYFDENHDYEWPPASPSEEGNFWSDYLNGSPETRFREIYGWWPNNTVTGTPVTAIGVNQGISFSSGHVQFEMQIDLSASDLNATPGDDIGIYIFTIDENIGYGNWPTEVELFGTTWRAPFMYGTLNLADDPTGIDDETPAIITKYQLLQNYPNPFNPITTIKYQLPNTKPQHTTLQIYNNLGQLVRTLVNAEQGNGEYTVVWDGLDNYRKEVASGIYFYKLQSGEFISTQKLLKLK